MKKILFLVVAMAVLIARQGDAKMSKMSDDTAKSKALALWGAHAAVAKFWVTGTENTWSYQVGCYDPTYGFHVTGQGLTSWEAAYANVDPAKNGQFSIFATVKQSDGQIAVSSTITIYGCDAIFDKNKASYAVANAAK